MSADMAVDYKTDSNPTKFDVEADQNRALHYEEKFLWDHQQTDHSGVDLPAVDGSINKTGITARAATGLPNLSEPQILRHFVRLSTLNYSIDHGFFPLGSCTMKHNPRLNEKMARLPGFAHIHPLQPEQTVQGALGVMYELQDWLAQLTGLPGVALSPAAGAHGEYAGIMVIRAKLRDAGMHHKDTLLIPDSAHGTNPATAAMCGFKVKTISTKETGRLTLEAFKDALGDGENIAGMMVTNPNTCGLFERDIVEISKLLHAAGGYFYCDGANFNALVGRIKPADFGVDVMHINLHKTFSTPHGGGGPGSGPICCTEELAPYLPIPLVGKSDDGFYKLLRKDDCPKTLGRLRGFNGQFGMHVRALSYMLSHGNDGLRQVSGDAVLAANYILSQLKDDYHVPFEGRCMHEALFSEKWLKDHGVTTLDVAKALIEFGMHPMTVYFPLVVSGAMLVEPTETETKESIDRFIAVMKHIAELAKNGEGDIFHSYPISAPRKRLDEVLAARNPILNG
ncbi:MAG: aminomethyl-transferring glycine dehydrogenase subunit GcvPB [Alphaproteobacteria bacterium]|nr:glycine dehydrogenase (aminomethyl-transferring) [Alphaproteobacteria bacterium]MCS5598037.1 aminomethyl-transferring glycine dehydrogenase subunit GcvPB [Alphaproteobacteria bacterium]